MKYINKIIHQTWKNFDVPIHLARLADSWKLYHTDWEYKFWTDEMNHKFIVQHHPDFLETYNCYPHDIQRVDAVRYFILYEMGGVFIDMDFECLKNIEPLLYEYTCVMGLEPIEHNKRLFQNKIICNAFMACQPKNEFFLKICKEIKTGSSKISTDNPKWLEILETTGPFKLTRTYDNYKRKETVKLLPSEVLYPFNIQEARTIIIEDAIPDDLYAKLDNAYAVHYFLGSWW